MSLANYFVRVKQPSGPTVSNFVPPRATHARTGWLHVELEDVRRVEYDENRPRRVDPEQREGTRLVDYVH
jgi:hypothetical protein